MSLSPEAKAQRQYKRLLMYEKLSLPNWDRFSQTLWDELMQTINARVCDLSEEEIRERHPTAESILAAELFPERESGTWMDIAKSETTTHTVLRLKGHPSEARLSANIIEVKGHKYCCLDSVMVETGTASLKTETDLQTIVQKLLAAGYIPLDSTLNPIPENFSEIEI